MNRCKRCKRFKFNHSLVNGYCTKCAELNREEALHKQKQQFAEAKRLAIQNGSIHYFVKDQYYDFIDRSGRIHFVEFPFFYDVNIYELDETEDVETGELYFYNMETMVQYEKKELGKPCPDVKTRVEACFDNLEIFERYQADFLQFFTDMDAVVYELPESLRKEYEHFYLDFDGLIVQAYDTWFLFEVTYGCLD